MSPSPRPAPLRRALLGAGVLGAAAAVTGCATPSAIVVSPQPLPAPRVRPGDRWRYAVINQYNGSKTGEILAQVRSVAPQVLVELTTDKGVRQGDELYSAPWQVIQEPFYGIVQIFDSPQTLLPAGIGLGASMVQRTAYRVPGQDDRYAWYARSEPVQWERVRVPAGEFDALRVQRDIFFAHSDRWRITPSRRETLWYAPQVNRWVQREWTGWYRWAGVRVPLREDWISWRLMEYLPAPISG